MEIHPTEIELLNRYAAAELAGSLLLGKYARMVEDPFLIARLTNHCYDEARHSWAWMSFMEENNIPIRSTHGRNDYFGYMSETQSVIDFLAAVHVYEMRVQFHLTCHSQVTRIHPGLKKVMLEIMSDEQYHLAWISDYFHKLQKEGNTEVGPAIEKAGALEDSTYNAYIQLIKKKDDYAKELAEIVEKNLPTYPFAWKDFLLNK
jgi:hypothetical protein